MLVKSYLPVEIRTNVRPTAGVNYFKSCTPHSRRGALWHLAYIFRTLGTCITTRSRYTRLGFVRDVTLHIRIRTQN